MRSYSSIRGIKHSGAEFLQLLRRVRRASSRITYEVSDLIEKARVAESFVRATTGLEVRNLDVLEIGPGQLPRQTAYFAANNRVTGVDADAIPVGFDPAGYLRLLRANDFNRTLKTIFRKALGFDRKFYGELCRQLGVRRLPAFKLLQMDAEKLQFADGSFDFVYSFSVFEHLPDPVAVIGEMKRVLRPGGVALTHLHLYTSDNGSHDMRIGKDDRAGLPYWPHLRLESSAQVQTFAYLNKVRLVDWLGIFERSMPRSHFSYDCDDEPHRSELSLLRAAGKLGEYTDEELLTRNLLVVWRKPLL